MNKDSGLLFITKAKGNITSNMIRLAPEFFKMKFEFNEHLSNTLSGFVARIDLGDFEHSYKLLEDDRTFEIKFSLTKQKLRIL